jgi:tRNA(Ile)-lysidine synthetase-like protein
MKFNLQKHILNKNLFEENETIILALSGGVDSMVLFHILNTIELNLNVIIAHVNHKKRQESNKEFEAIKEICGHKNVVFEGMELDTNLNGNFHDQSRRKRYQFFEDLADKYNAKKIVIAHHSDDQTETVLMRIVRGSSFTGYAGINEVREHNNYLYIRPLMDVKKEQIYEYAKEHHVTYFEDSSNQESFYTRNRYRLDIIPLLKEENSNLEEKITQFSTYINMADEVLLKLRDEFLERYFNNGEVNLKAFNELLPMIKIKVLKFIINSKTFDTVEVSFKQYEDMIELLSNENPNVTYNLSSGYILVKEYDDFFVEKERESTTIAIEINAIGEYIINSNLKYILSDEKLSIDYTDMFELWYNNEVFPLYLRSRENGDRMSLNVGTKKVKDILIDQKVPQLERENLILLCSRDKVLWIPSIKKSLQDKSCRNKIYVYEVR